MDVGAGLPGRRCNMGQKPRVCGKGVPGAVSKSNLSLGCWVPLFIAITMFPRAGAWVNKDGVP